MINNLQITGIILAGGKSSRMGIEKGLIRHRNKYLIEYSIDVLLKVCNQILISANDNSYNFLGYRVIPDEIPDCGPMGGIYSCLKKSKTSFNLVISCDTPMINQGLLEHIILNIGDHDIVVPTERNEHYEPLCAFYHQRNIPTLEKFIRNGNFKLRDVFKIVNFKSLLITRTLSFYKPNLFININSRKALYKLDKQE